jgi:hypothetical protein
MMATGSKYGSFNVEIPVGPQDQYDTHLNNRCYTIKNNNLFTIPMITQNELADGWLMSHPRHNFYYKTTINTNGEKVNTRVEGSYHFKINLAQLPENLWSRLNFLNEKSYYVNNGIYFYTVVNTPVDDEIRELYRLTKQIKCPEHKERVNELLNVLKDNDVYGWVVIRARNMY